MRISSRGVVVMAIRPSIGRFAVQRMQFSSLAHRMRSRNLRSERRVTTPWRLIAIVLTVCLVSVAAGSNAAGADRASDGPLRVAVYDVAPYGSVDAAGLFSGASVDLWRRVADHLHLTYRFIAVVQMEDVI